MPGVPAINLVLGLYNYTPSKKVVDEATALQTKAIEAQGAQGRQLLNDIDTYLAGINARMQVSQPTSPPFTRTDIYALNAIKSQFLGEGGGQEVDNALVPRRPAVEVGRQDRATRRSRTCAGATMSRRASRRRSRSPDQTQRQRQQAVRAGAAEERDVQELVHQAAGCRQGASASAASVGKRQLASNILIVSGSKSATGKPLFVGGPQIGFNYPGLTMEMQLTSPSINVEGVTSAPFPGYMLIGHGDRLRVVADLGRRRHHRHVRREAVRRLEGQVLLQGQVPEDGEGRGRHDHQGRRRREDHGRLLPHGPRPGHRLRQGREDRQAGRAVARSARPTDARPSTSCSTSR